MSVTKVCTKCKEAKRVSEFSYANNKTGQLRGDCKKCRSIYSKKYRESNIEAERERVNKWNSENKHRRYLNNKKWQENNRDKISEYNKKWYYTNPEKALKKRISRTYCEKQAKVDWSDNNKIKEIYLACKLLNMCSDTQYQVDHIIPLRGKNVSGLHVENNLQILTKYENLKKGNTFIQGVNY